MLPAPPESDLQFLALLVHRGHVDRTQAEQLVLALRSGRDLDDLLAQDLAWPPDRIAALRRTRCGEVPEIPGFDIQSCLGRGGTADVFRAMERRTRHVFALKVLRADVQQKKGALQAFAAEARLLEKLRHPGLVEGYGILRHGDKYFAKLELIEGATLLELLDAGRSFGEEDALRIVLSVAEALDHLERNGLVHRDVKPGNIMYGADGRTVLIDLGFCASQGACTSSADTTAGTVAYLSPEQARGGAAADTRSDIYSLGATLFHIVVGRLPFDASDDRELLRKQIMDSLASPELKRRQLSPHLHYFVEKMMAKDAGHRYQSWSELIEDIRAHLVGREELDFERAMRAGRPQPRRAPGHR